MTPYENFNGLPGVTAFELGEESIRVRMDNRKVYLFDFESTGKVHVQKMHELARSGKGLNQYIDAFVKDKYAAEFT